METSPVQSIVIVDDEKAFTDMIGRLLEDHFTAPVHAFLRPADALRDFPSLRAGIVVTDYYMPVMNGLDLIRAVYSISPDTPSILITGHTFNLEEHPRDGLKNLRAVLAKPFHWRQLAALIERHWHGDRPPGLRSSPASP